MLDDMHLRELSLKTQSHYIRAVKKLSRFLGHSPDTANTRPVIVCGR
jgi:integrase/recombinase XerD